ncbi:hypothetical protein BKA61DRAFT_678827 [Leptodontidium sp. MPI-SDFR-AT-0119]|nr:hypothetical protein BKA61DRAFT_678827 [Leptodontidium sp. MPI-SDFR-AT-0119]
MTDLLKRYTFLKLMIRKPPSSVTNGINHSIHSTLENDSICCELASSVALLYDAIPSQYPKVSFLFINYLINVTMIMFSIINKNTGFKEACQPAISSAVRTLKAACLSTWVSGKLIRTILLLDKLTRSTFGPAPGFAMPFLASEQSRELGRCTETRYHKTDTKNNPL